MEVHHPHHPAHKKNWSEYLLEFVMLFTAVTLGFVRLEIPPKLTTSFRGKLTTESYFAN